MHIVAIPFSTFHQQQMAAIPASLMFPCMDFEPLLYNTCLHLNTTVLLTAADGLG